MKITKKIIRIMTIGVSLISLNLLAVSNPASVFCEEKGGESILVRSQKGDFGICRFKDGTAMEEWEYYHSAASEAKEENAAARNLIIYYDKEASKKNLLKATEAYGAKAIYEYDNFKGIAVSIPREKNINEAVKYFEKVKGVLSVSRDQIMYLD